MLLSPDRDVGVRITGKRVFKQILTADRKLWGQLEIGPSGVEEKSNERMRSPISPPPLRK
jgi:hypothetical protein